MGLSYRAIGWNPYKRRYDLCLALGIGAYLGGFFGLGTWLHPSATAETLLIRGLATGAFLLLSLILCIGPLARLDAGFLPLLYNRRHLGVAMFLLAAAHAALATFQFHGFGVLDPLTSLFASNPRSDSFSQFPFEWLGLGALAILFLMAASSHDFWLTQWSAPVWKRLHLAVYAAYWLIVLHVALGPLSDEPRAAPWILFLGLAGSVAALQLSAALRESARDRPPGSAAGGWIPLGSPAEFLDGQARVVLAAGERVAVFRDGPRFFALSSVCQHQNGPLGEGRVRRGCAVCPWHGYEYRLDSGRSPEPFNESVPQFRLRLNAGLLELDPRPLPPGTGLDPVEWSGPAAPPQPAKQPPVQPFFIGYAAQLDARSARGLRLRVAAAAALCLGLGALAAVGQPQFARANFEFGQATELAGYVRLAPTPHLEIPRPAANSSSRYLLVAPGKHGASALLQPYADRFVQLRGSLAYRQGATLVEVEPGSITAATAPAESLEGGLPAPLLGQELGSLTLRGEIVDSKCFLGVMKPGELRSHRACASLCIRGGIPPVLCVRQADGSAEYWLLIDLQGAAVNLAVLPYVAEPVEISGLGQRLGELSVLRFEPSSIRRL